MAHPALRIAIIDGERARFVQADADGELRTISANLCWWPRLAR